MALNIGASGIIRPYVKYNAKSDKWFIRAEGGGDLEIARPTFLLDLANIRTGWLRFQEGQAPERLIDPALDKVAPTPGEGFKRGFVVMAFSPKFFGGAEDASQQALFPFLLVLFEQQAGEFLKAGVERLLRGGDLAAGLQQFQILRHFLSRFEDGGLQCLQATSGEQGQGGVRTILQRSFHNSPLRSVTIIGVNQARRIWLSGYTTSPAPRKQFPGVPVSSAATV